MALEKPRQTTSALDIADAVFTVARNLTSRTDDAFLVSRWRVRGKRLNELLAAARRRAENSNATYLSHSQDSESSRTTVRSRAL